MEGVLEFRVLKQAMKSLPCFVKDYGLSDPPQIVLDGIESVDEINLGFGASL